MKNVIVNLFTLIVLLTGCRQETASVPEPFPPVPNQAQLSWHQAEYIMFVHFGMKTFYPSSDHMGYGKEDPEKFNPLNFDANQWVAAAQAGGFKGIVITAKHHDGFCNWQTNTTDHSVKSSPWKNGKGDIIAELMAACRAGGLYFGVYVSIIDKHFEVAGSPDFDNYGDYYFEQLKELSTNYGAIDEYWFDGYQADGLNMDYSRIANLIRETQPNAVVYESGTMVKFLPDRSIAWPGAHGGLGPDQNYRVSIEGELCWYPPEPSIILQGNWFHNNSPMIPLKNIQDYYLSSVGYGATPLMNVSPNSHGLIDEASVQGLKEFKQWVDELNTNAYANSKGIKISSATQRGKSTQFAPQLIWDDQFETYYATDDDLTQAKIEIDLGKTKEIRGFLIQEYIPLGQRITGYSIDCWINDEWVEVFSGKSIGYKRIILEGRVSASDLQFPATSKVRLNLTDALACPLISTFWVL